jgi:hypothetical protein
MAIVSSASGVLSLPFREIERDRAAHASGGGGLKARVAVDPYRQSARSRRRRARDRDQEARDPPGAVHRLPRRPDPAATVFHK